MTDSPLAEPGAEPVPLDRFYTDRPHLLTDAELGSLITLLRAERTKRATKGRKKAIVEEAIIDD